MTCLTGGAQLADLVPGVTLYGHDVGWWLQRQRQPIVWKGLMPQQRERLAQLGTGRVTYTAVSRLLL
ncbi:helicase associated domain-containing protein [Streptomyces sp. NPDC093064]|uniref:helicase associated domain-containing protein n=1 Tax=Streptomyces sp. NPDC093064 TaxID=3366020 RepID=UPI0037F9943D